MPPIFTPDQYSQSQTTDLETAISLAVARALDVDYPGPGGQGSLRFAQVFEDWASFEENFISPGAVVLPEGELLYGPSHPTPALIEESWEPKGEPGLGLYVLSEASREFQVQIRSSSREERNALKAGVEGVFVYQSVLIAPPQGQRYGIVVPMPEYWNLPVRLAILGSRKLDDADLAAKNQWEAEIRITAQANHVVLRPVQPFRVRVQQIEVGDDVVLDPPPS